MQQDNTQVDSYYALDWLSYHAQLMPEKLAIRELATQYSLSYFDLHQRTQRLVAVFQKQFEIQKQDRVAILCETSADFFEMLFACWHLGAVAVPLNFRLAPAELTKVLASCNPGLVICDAQFLPNLEAGFCPILVREGRTTLGDSYETALLDAEGLPKRFQGRDQDLAMILYTSGTTGTPKGVLHTYGMVRDAIFHAILHGELTGSSKTLGTTPLFHVAGIYGFSLPLFVCGGTLLLSGRWDPDQCLTYLQDGSLAATHTLGVPLQFQTMAQCSEFDRAVFPTLKVAGVGAAPVPRSLLETWHRKGVQLSQSYGLTEAFSVAFLPASLARKKQGSAGKRVLGTEIQVGNSQGEPLAFGQMGEIQIRGKTVTPGYWCDPIATQKAFTGGWFKTGDLGIMDSEETLYIVGRDKDMYISGGENVYPAEVEKVLLEHPGIDGVAVLPFSDNKWGQSGLAVLSRVNREEELDPGKLREFCQTRLASYKIPKLFYPVARLPVSPQGKILKTRLLDSLVPGGHPIPEVCRYSEPLEV